MRTGARYGCLLLLRQLVGGALVIAAAVLTTPVHAAPERAALVIGNSRYQNIPSLQNPATDAASVAKKLTGLGFEVRLVTDADLAEMRQALTDFSAEAGAAETELAVVYFAGHGVQLDGKNYFLPVDAKVRDKAGITRGTLSDAEIWERLSEARPEVALLILDACRENPFKGELGSSAGLATGSVSPSAVMRQNNFGGMLIGFAAAPGAVAFDGREGGNSPFTTALLQWMDEPGLELGVMFRRVRSTVLELTLGQQVPWVEEALLRDVFLHPGDPTVARIGLTVNDAFAGLAAGMASPIERAVTGEFLSRVIGNADEPRLVQVAYAGEPMDRDEFLSQGLVWLSASANADPETMMRFVEAYPDSPFASLAREQLKLTTAPASSDEPKQTLTFAPAGDPVVTDREVATTIGTADGTPAPLVLTYSAPPTPGNLVFTPLPAAQDDGEAAVADGASPSVDSTADQALSVQVALNADPAATDENPGTDAAVTPVMEVAQPDDAALESPDPAAAEAALAASKADFVAVQLMLAQAGLYRGPIDGLVGRGTRGALGEFQTRHQLSGTGQLDQPTASALVGAFARLVLREDLSPERRLAVHNLAAKAAGGADARPVVVTIAAHSRNDRVHSFWDELARRFSDDNPGTVVEFTHQRDMDYRANLLSLLGAADPPEIIMTWGGGHLDALRRAGFVRDLTADMGEGWALEFRPGALQNFTLDGRIYGAPSHMALISLYVNRTMMERAGVPLAQLATWDGLLEGVATLKTSGIVPIAIGGGDRWPLQTIWGSLALDLGGREAFEAAFRGEGEGFASPTFVEAGRELAELAALEPFQPDFATMNESDASRLFAEGGAAMAVTGSWRPNSMRWQWPGGLAKMEQELVRVDFPRVSAESSAHTYGGVNGYAVTSKAPPVAVEFLRLLTSRETELRMAELANDVPAVSGSDLSLENPMVAEVAAEILSSEYHQLYYDQALGPVTGEVVNDVATQLATGAIEASAAASAIEASWREMRFER